MTDMGHNENAVRLAALAGDAVVALDKVAKGEAEAFDGWLAYGAALNEGRALFPSDEKFGQWVREQRLDAHASKDERTAAIWAAANADQLDEARASCAARTPLGLHRQWKKIEAEREEARQKEERRKREEAEKAEREKLVAEAKAAKEKADAEADDARKAVASAKDDEERKAAQAKADEAEKAKAAATAAVEKAKEPNPDISDPYAKERKKLAKYTREGLEDELIEARIALAEKGEKLRAARSKLHEAQKEAKYLKERLEEHTTDKDVAIRRQADKLRQNESRFEQINQALGREKSRSFGLSKAIKEKDAEIAKLRRELEQQEIVL